ncbi:predicted GPI-anchored protein 58 [Pyrgilauda ruficollis]|uniref:predicted GPI-anchored protein 58 n=1 Tax=Pyrgilauda ruficollis TaxID=221976 RepID=UPI001B87D94C|nr:predicted GPI-anchored protein 58 [Pyrgilauda ruficollis]
MGTSDGEEVASSNWRATATADPTPATVDARLCSPGSSGHVCDSASLIPPSEAAFRCSTSPGRGPALSRPAGAAAPAADSPPPRTAGEGGTASVIGGRNSRTDCSISFPVVSYEACADVLATPCAIVSACRRAFVPANVASPVGSPPFFHGACADGSDSGTGSVSAIAGDSAAAQLPAAARPASASAAGTPAVAAPAADAPASGLATSPSAPQSTAVLPIHRMGTATVMNANSLPPSGGVPWRQNAVTDKQRYRP